MKETLLILGGARSGKSRFAEEMVLTKGKTPIYIATAQALDTEMEQRIVRHQNRRGDGWQTVEAPFELVEAINQVATPTSILLIDCLTLWISNLMLAKSNLETASNALCDLVANPPCDMVLVANEVGLGIVPDNALARTFRDVAGLLNQQLAAQVNSVYLVTAGLPLCLKPSR